MIFKVIGNPQGKQRPRFNLKTKTIYTPKDTVVYENNVRQAYIAAGGEMISKTKPIGIAIEARFIRARTNKKSAPTLKPDADNIAKIVMDALNGVAYKDDSQVVDICVYKTWAVGMDSYVKVEVYEIDE